MLQEKEEEKGCVLSCLLLVALVQVFGGCGSLKGVSVSVRKSNNNSTPPIKRNTSETINQLCGLEKQTYQENQPLRNTNKCHTNTSKMAVVVALAVHYTNPT
ncbi:hypothetical protein E2C01_004478 [Portunus trituberculatus]|uniref:Uncharacterized protein n=1 Tax=Portunus trituberculatus TaxID=210409 RepID=A0A5B7CWH3_PORTR|nr:hypothetical protein [Portunus trituberculatus]